MRRFWTDYQILNESRSERWHPGGINQWDRQDWMNALAGEVWEFLDPFGDQPAEAADVLGYIFAFASFEGFSDLGGRVDLYVPKPDWDTPRNLFGSWIPAMNKLHGAVKEDSRNRDGAAGKGWDDDRINATICEHLEYMAKDLIQWAARHLDGMTMAEAVTLKFNEVSEQYGFPERL